MVSMDTIDLIHTPAVTQSPAPIVRAETLPVKTQRALCLAASRRVVMNDLSPTPAIATVAKAVVNPATIFKNVTGTLSEKSHARCFRQYIWIWLQ